MINFQHDFSLGWAEVWSTIYPDTLRFPGYKDPDKDGVQAYQEAIEQRLWKKIFIPDIRTGKGIARIIDEENVDTHVKADAVVTQMRDRAVAMLTADCSPILLSDPNQGVIWWIHGSMKAIKDWVIESTFCLLEDEFSTKREDVEVFIWPTICQNHYEVSEWDEEGFQDINMKPWEQWKVLLDIRWEVVYRLWETWALEDKIISPSVCTYWNEDKFSFRRKTHLKAQNKPFTHANNWNLIWFWD